MEPPEVNNSLTLLPELIEIKGDETINAKERWQTFKAEYEKKIAEITLTYKAKYPDATQSDLKAQATVGSHSERLQMIMAESKYRKLQVELQRLRDELDTTKEKSFNMRASMKIFKG